MKIYCNNCDWLYEDLINRITKEADIKKFDGQLNQFLREAFAKLGWEFGVTAFDIKKCPNCKAA
jgi:hypothetical protein